MYKINRIGRVLCTFLALGCGFAGSAACAQTLGEVVQGQRNYLAAEAARARASQMPAPKMKVVLPSVPKPKWHLHTIVRQRGAYAFESTRQGVLYQQQSTTTGGHFDGWDVVEVAADHVIVQNAQKTPLQRRRVDVGQPIN